MFNIYHHNPMSFSGQSDTEIKEIRIQIHAQLWSLLAVQSYAQNLIYSEIHSIVFSGAYSPESVPRIAAWVTLK